MSAWTRLPPSNQTARASPQTACKDDVGICIKALPNAEVNDKITLSSSIDPLISSQKEWGWSGTMSPLGKPTVIVPNYLPVLQNAFWEDLLHTLPTEGQRQGWPACSSPEQLLFSRAELKVIHYPLSAKFYYTETFLPFPLHWESLSHLTLKTHTVCREEWEIRSSHEKYFYLFSFTWKTIPAPGYQQNNKT